MLVYFWSTWICVTSRVHQAALAWQKFQHWTLCENFSTIFHTCHVHRHHWLLLFCTTFNDLGLGWGSQGQRKAKPLGFIFSHTLQLIRMKFIRSKAIQVEHANTSEMSKERLSFSASCQKCQWCSWKKTWSGLTLVMRPRCHYWRLGKNMNEPWTTSDQLLRAHIFKWSVSMLCFSAADNVCCYYHLHHYCCYYDIIIIIIIIYVTVYDFIRINLLRLGEKEKHESAMNYMWSTIEGSHFSVPTMCFSAAYVCSYYEHHHYYCCCY